MKLDVKLAFQNIFNSETWKSKFVIYAILMGIVALFPAESIEKHLDNLEKTNSEIFAATALVVLIWGLIVFICGLITQGYNAKYLHNLMIKNDAELLKWEKVCSLFCYGIKPIIPIVGLIIIGSLLLSVFQNLSLLLSLLFMIVLFIYSGALFLTYSQSLKMWDILNIKKANKYFGKEYFSFLGIMLLSIVIIVVLGGIAGLVFIPVLAALPICISLIVTAVIVSALCATYQLWVINMLSQVHHACIEKIMDKEE